jgi:hypothetical protein
MLNWKGMMGVGALHFLFGQYHAHSIHLLIFIIGLVSLFIIRDKSYLKQTLLIFLLFFLVSLTLSFSKSKYYAEYFSSIKNIGVQIRFYTLFPVMWYCYFGWVMYRLYSHFNYSKKLLGVIAIQVLVLMFSVYTRDFYGNTDAENKFRYTFLKKDLWHADFDTYYKKTIFDQIRSHLKDCNSNLECLGFPPECAQLNGFYTFGAYHYYYPFEKGKIWQKINYKELVKAYGSDKVGMPRQLHLVSSELLKGATSINNLELDFEELKAQNCFYLISRVPITNSCLIIEKQFNSETDHLFLYKII